MARQPRIECPPEKLRLLKQLIEQKRQVENARIRAGLANRPWQGMARPKQLPPHNPRHHLADENGNSCGCGGVDEGYEVFLFCAGRGVGKTLSGSNNIVTDALAGCTVNPGGSCHQCPHTFAVCAPTRDHLKQTCFEGDSGILSALEDGEYTSYNKSLLMVTMRNGNVIRGFSAENEERYRGPNLSGVWVDELGVFRHEGVWHQMKFALRIGLHPRVYVTTTPRPTKLIRQLFKDVESGKVHLTTGSTTENAANLSATMLESLHERYGGTRLGRQELEGSLLEDIEGSLWNRDWFDRDRVSQAPADLTRVVVAMDPAVTTGEDSDETGIIVAASAADGHAYILADLTRRDTPFNCCRRAVDAYHEFRADAIVGEQNNGGDYIRDLVSSVDPAVTYRQVYATRGKATRAQPVSSLYEQGKVHHVGSFPDLEDQMCCPAGTLVETARGQLRIEQVLAGDLVMTRNGFAPVAWAGVSGVTDTLVSVTHATGSVELTACHPVLIGQEFVNASNVLPGQSLAVSPRWVNTARRLPGVAAGGTRWPLVTTGTRGASYSTVRYGSSITGRFRRGTPASFTTSITTPATTVSPTLPWSRPKNTPLSTRRAAGSRWTPRPGAGTRLNGGLATRDASSPAPSAGTCSGQGTSERAAAHHQSAVESVGTVRLGKPTLVYNLTVASGYLPEFYANGILVHNCTWLPDDLDSPDRMDALVWGVHWLRDMFSGSWSSAYGTHRCEGCGHMFVAERGACPACARPFPAAA